MSQAEMNALSEGRLIATLCHTDDCCPQVFWLNVGPDGLAIKVRDDWGYEAYFAASAPPDCHSFEDASWYQLITHGIPSDDIAGKGEYVKLVGPVGFAFMTEAQRQLLLDQIDDLVEEQMASAALLRQD